MFMTTYVLFHYRFWVFHATPMYPLGHGIAQDATRVQLKDVQERDRRDSVEAAVREDEAPSAERLGLH